jgi:c(7)-type cytochrome triheme protein
MRHIFRNRLSRLLLMAALALAGAALAADRLPLAKDGVHDPANPGLKLLQEPSEALAKLPPDVVGNRVRWVHALERGLIAPRTNIMPETKIKVLDQDVIMPRTGEMPMVRFPHKQHTEWLDCSNCHEKLFKSKAGANKQVNMFQILQGEYCGVCHGAVAFPLTECKRCHSVERK